MKTSQGMSLLASKQADDCREMEKVILYTNSEMASTITSVEGITKEMEEVSDGEQQIIQASENLITVVDKLDKAMSAFTMQNNSN